jgi:HAD superfamily hydrolase (TIGR01509 family)
MLQALIFDFDGIIADNEPVHLQMFRKVLAPLGIRLTDEEYYTIYLGMDDKGCFSEVLKRHGRNPSPAEIERLIEEKTRHFTAHIQDHLVIFPGVVSFVETAARRYPLAIASGALRHEIELILKAAGIRRAFQTIVSAEDVAEGKPDPEGFLKARERLSAAAAKPLLPGECLVIEDSLAGMEAARKAGMKCMIVTNTYPKERFPEADRIVDSLEDCRMEDIETLF